MKRYLFFALFVLLCAFASEETPEFEFTWQIAVALLAGIYEVVIRVIPTVSNYSFIGKIIDILKWVSEFLNNKRK